MSAASRERAERLERNQAVSRGRGKRRARTLTEQPKGTDTRTTKRRSVDGGAAALARTFTRVDRDAQPGPRSNEGRDAQRIVFWK